MQKLTQVPFFPIHLIFSVKQTETSGRNLTIIFIDDLVTEGKDNSCQGSCINNS